MSMTTINEPEKDIELFSSRPNISRRFETKPDIELSLRSKPQQEEQDIEDATARLLTTKSSSKGLSFASKLMLLSTLALQNATASIIGRHIRTGSNLFDINNFVLTAEIIKLLVSAAVEGYQLPRSLRIHVIERPLETLKVALPALFYLGSNTLLYMAISNLTVPVCQVAYQFKLIATALVSVALLKRRYNARQWCCLVAISVGVAVVVLGEEESKEEGHVDKEESKEEDHAEKVSSSSQNLTTGLACVITACWLAALSGVYFEKVLKHESATQEQPSMWMRNIQLSAFSVLIATVKYTLTPSEKSFFHGFHTLVWIQLLLMAGGGLLVAAAMKYTDNVIKGIAICVSVVLGAVGSRLLFHTPLTLQFSLGSTLILSAVYLFSNPIPKCR